MRFLFICFLFISYFKNSFAQKLDSKLCVGTAILYKREFNDLDSKYSPLITVRANTPIKNFVHFSFGGQINGIGVKSISPWYKHENIYASIPLGVELKFKSCGMLIHYNPRVLLFDHLIEKDTNLFLKRSHFLSKRPNELSHSLSFGGYISFTKNIELEVKFNFPFNYIESYDAPENGKNIARTFPSTSFQLSANFKLNPQHTIQPKSIAYRIINNLKVNFVLYAYDSIIPLDILKQSVAENFSFCKIAFIKQSSLNNFLMKPEIKYLEFENEILSNESISNFVIINVYSEFGKWNFNIRDDNNNQLPKPFKEKIVASENNLTSLSCNLLISQLNTHFLSIYKKANP